MANEGERRGEDTGQSPPSHFTSFVLRCWVGDGGQMRARLTDVHSGLSYPVADPADLPGLVSHLVAQDQPGESSVGHGWAAEANGRQT